MDFCTEHCFKNLKLIPLKVNGADIQSQLNLQYSLNEIVNMLFQLLVFYHGIVLKNYLKEK